MEKPGRFIGENTPQIPQQQTQQDTKPNKVIGNLMQEERVNNFISQTSPTNSLENINYILQGFVYNSNQREWVKVSDEIPKRIRLDFLQFITPDLSEDVRMTNLSPVQINGIMSICIEWVTDYLYLIDDKEISEEQMSKIGFILLKAVFYTLLRSQEGMERNKIFKSLSLDGEINPTPNKSGQDKKFWQFWK